MATANNDFKLIGPSHTWWDPTVTLSCCLSPEISAVNMEIQWFKETDCVCVYKNRQVIVGRAYKGRVRLFTQELETGNISLELRDCTESDEGHYLCQVIDGDRRGEITVKMEAWDDEEEEEESSDSDDEEEGDDENDDEEEESSDSSDKEWTEDERMRMKKSALQTVSSVECYSSEVEEFSPELVKKCVDDNSKNKYRFQFPHAGQFKCKLTDLKFMMEREGEVLYSTVSWNSYPLDGLGQKEPAGPLYSIDCHKGLIKYLHLPHSKTSELEMNVAHMAGGYWEITQPLSVTNTHVIIDVEGLSLLGLIKTRPSNADPIEAQVLLFFKKNIGKNRKSKLHMYLLPGDVAAEEVQKKHGKKTHVETSGSCELTPDKKYEPFIKDNNLEFTVQPKSKKFKRDYSPNCQPTFEVIFKTEVDEITIGLLDERKEEVWSREVLLTNTEADSLQVNTAGADFMDQHRETLIQRVPSVMEIADCLKSKKRITDEMYNKMKVPSITSQDQMRLLYSAIDSGGKTVKEKVYKILKKKFPDIVNDLESA